MSSSIDGFPFQHIPDDQIAQFLGISPAEARAQRPALRSQLGDPTWLARTLDGLPAATLGLLGLVLEHGGVVLESELVRAAHERYGLSPQDVGLAIQPAYNRLLALPLRTRSDERGTGIVHPAGASLGALLSGLQRAVPPGAFVASEAGPRNPRTFLAVCMATRHVDVRITNDDRPHRTAIKRLAKQLALDEELVSDLVLLGWGVGALQIDDDVLRPAVAVLGEAAAGRYPRSVACRLAHHMLARGPMRTRALMTRLMNRDLAVPRGFSMDTFACLPGFAVGTIEGSPAVARVDPEGATAGHVTPSFEVMLPPEARLVDIVQIGACCEWDRIDRAIVGRITKAAVARAVGAGATGFELVAQLAAASRHPVPQNVEMAILDWAGATVRATITTGHVIVVAASARDRAKPALAPWSPSEPAPGVFVVSAGVSFRELRAALQRASVVTVEPPAAVPDDELDVTLPDELEVAPSPAALRLGARVGAWRRGAEFEGERDDFLDRVRAAARDHEAEAKKSEQALAQWAKRRGFAIATDAAVYPHVIKRLAVMGHAKRDALLASAKTMLDLVRGIDPDDHAGARAQRAKPPRRPRREERRLPPLLWQTSDVRAVIEAAVKAGKPLALDTPDGARFLRVERVIRRGQAWVVLGEDLMSTEPIALPLDTVHAVAALPDDLAAYGLVEGGRDDGLDEDDEADGVASDGDAALPFGPAQPWRPAPGQAVPPGHVACPCGSGERYRSCCRKLATV